MIEQEMAAAAEQQQRTGEPARVFAELEYQTLESWSQPRRVVAKAEQLSGKENPRSATSFPPPSLTQAPETRQNGSNNHHRKFSG